MWDILTELIFQGAETLLPAKISCRKQEICRKLFKRLFVHIMCGKIKTGPFCFLFFFTLRNEVHNQDPYARFFPFLLYILDSEQNWTMIFKYVVKYTLN